MPKSLAALLLAVTACSGEQDHGHDHDHDGAHDAPAAEPVAPQAPADAPLSSGAMGPFTVSLFATDEGVRVTAVDVQGNTVEPTGDIHLALTAASGGTEMTNLAPDGDGWSGTIPLSDEGAYMAQLTSSVGSARLMWGATSTGHEMKTPEPADDADAHDHGGHDHGHDH